MFTVDSLFSYQLGRHTNFYGEIFLQCANKKTRREVDLKFAEPNVWLQSGVLDQLKPESLRRQSLTTKFAAALNQGLSSLGDKLGEPACEHQTCC